MIWRVLFVFSSALLGCSGYAYDANLQDLDSMRLKQFEYVCKNNNINDLFAGKLRQLEGFKIVIIADDSSSMNELAGTILTSGSPYSHKPTRWEELKTTVKIIVEVAAVLDKSGVDLFFLNRSGQLGITNSDQILPFFDSVAQGSTPIVPALRNVFKHKIDGKRLIILATDGMPTDQFNSINIPEFYNLLKDERGPQDYVTIVACTDDEKTMAYLNNWDVKLPRLDVVDDYGSEKREILSVQGQNFNFSFGDYVVKTLLGSIDPWFDSLDERPVGGVIHDGCKCVLF